MANAIQLHTDLNLQSQAASLVGALGGIWREHGSMCRCPAHDDRTPSLSIRVGERALLFKCFAGCTTTEILSALRRLRIAISPARGATAENPIPAKLGTAMSTRAVQIWRSARRLAGSRGEAYLAARGIRTGSVALRYHPRTPIGRGQAVRFRPALIAAVRQGDTIIAIQRLFLDRDRRALAADMVRPKRLLGRPGSGAVMLTPASDRLGLAEGVETALSATALLDIPVWAALGSERLSYVAIPAGVRRLILLPDNDRAGRLAASRAREAHVRDGLEIETLWPWAGLNDWNDVLRREGEMGGEWLRRAV
jgi:hypothetical protein